MSVKDIIKTKVYESLAGNTGLGFWDICGILLLAVAIGLYIFIIYRCTSKKAFYSKDLNVTMAGMVIVVAAIMIAMQSNLLVSLGMVGALSIVRFRNAVKNPLDILYIFWGISAGIICGVGLKMLAIVLCVVMTVFLMILEALPNLNANHLLMVRISNCGAEKVQLDEIVKKNTRFRKEKSCCVRNGEMEVIWDVRCDKKNQLLEEIEKCEGIMQISYLEYDGEFRA